MPSKEDFFCVLKSKNITFLGDKHPSNRDISINVKCNKENCDYKWETKFINISRSKNGCPKCAGNLKITIDQYRNLGNKKVTWIDIKIPKNVMTKTKFQCLKCEYEFLAKYNEVEGKHLTGCPKCAGNLKITIEQYKNLDNKNVKWIGTKLPKNTKTGTDFQCLECKYIFVAVYDCVNGKRKTGCPKCCLTMKKTIEDYQKLDNDKVKWIGKEIPNDTGTKTEFQCLKCEYKFLAVYDSVNGKQKSGCPKCGGTMKKSIEDYKKLDNNEVKWIGINIPENTDTKTEFQCLKCNYVIIATYKSINIRKKTGCPKCNNRLKKIIDHYQNLDNKKVKWVGIELPKNTYTNTDFQCLKCNNIFQNIYERVNGTKKVGCPQCIGYKNEEECREILEDLFQAKFPKTRPKFLQKLEYDGYLESFKVAFEYHGEQHFNYIPSFFHKKGEHVFQEQKERDLLKIKLSEENNVALIIIPYTAKTIDQKKEIIKDHIKKFGILIFDRKDIDSDWEMILGFDTNGNFVSKKLE